MATFVLVHGSWHGAWCWERLVPWLHEAGHTVVARDLPGHGADAPGYPPKVGAPGIQAQYVPAVCAWVAEQSEPVILVGHSSGGVIISEVARRCPERVAALVYLAAFLLPPGVTPPEAMRGNTESLLPGALEVDPARGLTRIRPERARAVFYHDCTEADAAWATSRLGPEPMVPAPGAQAAPSAGAGSAPAAEPAIPRACIECTEDRALPVAVQRRMYGELPCRWVFSLPTGHSPFLSAPDALAACLLDVARAL